MDYPEFPVVSLFFGGSLNGLRLGVRHIAGGGYVRVSVKSLVDKRPSVPPSREIYLPGTSGVDGGQSKSS
jgi:hypothetical protein